MMIICAKLLSNPTLHNKVMGRIQIGFTEVYAQSLSADCGLDLQPSDMVLIGYTSSYHVNHLCQLFSNPTMHSKVMGWTRTGLPESIHKV